MVLWSAFAKLEVLMAIYVVRLETTVVAGEGVLLRFRLLI